MKQTGKYSVTTYYNARLVLNDEHLIEEHDLALIDLAMPNIDGFSFLQSLKSRSLPLKVLIISGIENRDSISNLLQLGAKGFVPKHSPSQVMLEAVETVLNGGRYIPPNLLGTIEIHPCFSSNQQITNPQENSLGSIELQNLEDIRPRQLEVLALIKDGHSNKEIAQIMGITESTVKSHIKILFSTLSVKNRTACVKEGIKYKLI